MEFQREQIYYYALRYKGDYRQIARALEKGEHWEKVPMEQDCLVIYDSLYPASLYDLELPPWILFYKGDLELLKAPKAAMVGSRTMSEYGIRTAAALSRTLSEKYVIVSGMASGTDRVCQENAVKTIGVLGSGINIVYPAANIDLYRKVWKEGLLLSEYPSGTKPRKYYFPFRNRIIAALGEKLVVPAARETGGTMTTVTEALKLGRDIYTVPYPTDDPDGAGCNRLIEDGAGILLKEEDLRNL